MYNYAAYRKILMLCLLTFTFFTASAQDVVHVKGTVKDDKGEAVLQASISIEGTKDGTITDVDGKFAIDAPANGFLVISHLGYANVRIAVKEDLLISMKPTSTTLNDVVVIGYGTVSRQELTGSVSKVSEKDFQDGTITTPEQLIQGKVSGVSITQNGGSPGSGSTIRIRGAASLNANNDPLIIIDGLPIVNTPSTAGTGVAGASNPLSLINPNDIESFTVLKDAAATAIYGSRASNGVIIITTKKGTKGKPVFNFTTNTSLSTLQKEADVTSASDFRNYVNTNPIGSTTNNGIVFKSLLGNANTDWQKEIYQKALTTDNNFSVSGALKNLPYRVSIGYLNQDGMLKTDNLQRYSGGISLSPSLLKDHLKINVNVKGTMEDTRFANGAAISSAVYFDPTQPVYTAGSPYGGFTEWANGTTLNKLAPRNPLALLDLYHNTSNVYRSIGNAQFDYKMPFLPELHANLNLGYDAAKGSGGVYVPAYAAQNFLDTGQNNKYSNKLNNTVGEFYLNYNKTIPSIKSNINATAGYGYYNNITTNYNYYSYRANNDTVSGTKPTYPFDQQQNTLISYYARLIYTFDNRYIFAGTIRADGSSRFAADGGYRWGSFPSAAFTWRINKEQFLVKAKQLSLLNLRLSYGITGQQEGIANYSYIPNYSLSSNSTSLTQLGNEFYSMATPAAYNTTIKWEQTATSNVGIDFGFFNNRFSGTIDAYYKKTSDLLNVVPIPAGTNFSSVLLENIGNLENKGIELQLNGTPIQNKHFTWDIGFNITYSKSKVTKLTASSDSTFAGTPVSNGVQIYSVGYEPLAFYVYHQAYDANGKPIEGVYADINKDGTINSKDLYHDKSPFPKFVFGFSTQLTYNKWSLRTVLRANVGNYMYNSVAQGASISNVFNSLGYLANTSSDLKNTNFNTNQPLSDYYVQDASFLKMDNLTLAYNIGKVLNNKLGISVNVYCQNVFTITKYKGLDPEIYGGYDASLYPRPRIYGVGVNLKF